MMDVSQSLDAKAPPPVFDVRSLKVSYGKFEAVKGVSFTVERGEIFALVGESGSGKSTIAKALVGLEKPSGGEIVRDPSCVVQMVFQDATGSLNPRMTVRQTLEEAVKVRKTGRDAKALLRQVGLSEAVLGQYPREMSGGQCQRISIARALAAGGDVLVADEPVSALDVSVQARVLNLLRDLRRELGLTIILIVHDLAVVKNVCDRVAVMEHGRFVDFGDSSHVFEHPTSDYTRRLLAAVPDVRKSLTGRFPGKML